MKTLGIVRLGKALGWKSSGQVAQYCGQFNVESQIGGGPVGTSSSGSANAGTGRIASRASRLQGWCDIVALSGFLRRGVRSIALRRQERHATSELSHGTSPGVPGEVSGTWQLRPPER